MAFLSFYISQKNEFIVTVKLGKSGERIIRHYVWEATLCSITVPVVDSLGGVPLPNELEKVNKKVQV